MLLLTCCRKLFPVVWKRLHRSTFILSHTEIKLLSCFCRISAFWCKNLTDTTNLYQSCGNKTHCLLSRPNSVIHKWSGEYTQILVCLASKWCLGHQKKYFLFHISSGMCNYKCMTIFISIKRIESYTITNWDSMQKPCIQNIWYFETVFEK